MKRVVRIQIQILRIPIPKDEKRRKKRKANPIARSPMIVRAREKQKTPKKGWRQEPTRGRGLIKQMNLLTRDDPKYGISLL